MECGSFLDASESDNTEIEGKEESNESDLNELETNKYVCNDSDKAIAEKSLKHFDDK